VSYELRLEESLGDALRRICRKQIEQALEIAKGANPRDDSPVHETRKHLKKARAVLRLVKKELGPALFKQHDHRLRDVGRMISDVRDAEVRLQTVRQLQDQTRGRNGGNYPGIEETLGLELENFVAGFADWQTRAIPLLQKAAEEISQCSLDKFDCRDLRKAVQQTYKKARRRLTKAKTTHAAEDFHGFRTKAKQVVYQLNILRPLNSVVAKNLSDELHAVSSLLGRAHDLSFLRDRLQRERQDPELQSERCQLLTTIEENGPELERAASDLADHFFAERPRDFGDRIAGWLEGWEEKNPKAGKKPVC
jgi:CHAD domain-containing protein